ncbi:MAG: 2Fe-2S iron-sulfur cluster-binding protein [Dehalococcoidales bacterium]|nr:2Fe-2S iron-sulfur cluster-binding protein [Dehalococcoidales bacterium]
MVTLKIDGREIQAESGKTVLEAAQDNNIYIPTLCVSEAVAAYGACRLCMVEITTGKRKRLVASCLYEVSNGLVIETQTERVLNIRRLVMELLLARCPNSPEVIEMARSVGIEASRFQAEEENNFCVLCALCTRVCREVVGKSAISLVSRGTERKVALPFCDDADACIACGSCAQICPTDAITMEDQGDKRIITWPSSSHEFKMKKCESCGNYFAPEKQVSFMMKKSGLEAEKFNLCMTCRP